VPSISRSQGIAHIQPFQKPRPAVGTASDICPIPWRSTQGSRRYRSERPSDTTDLFSKLITSLPTDRSTDNRPATVGPTFAKSYTAVAHRYNLGLIPPVKTVSYGTVAGVTFGHDATGIPPSEAFSGSPSDDSLAPSVPRPSARP
jgi:hypothetical protein